MTIFANLKCYSTHVKNTQKTHTYLVTYWLKKLKKSDAYILVSAGRKIY